MSTREYRYSSCPGCGEELSTKGMHLHLSRHHGLGYEPLQHWACGVCGFRCDAFTVIAKHCLKHNHSAAEVRAEWNVPRIQKLLAAIADIQKPANPEGGERSTQTSGRVIAGPTAVSAPAPDTSLPEIDEDGSGQDEKPLAAQRRKRTRRAAAEEPEEPLSDAAADAPQQGGFGSVEGAEAEPVEMDSLVLDDGEGAEEEGSGEEDQPSHTAEPDADESEETGPEAERSARSDVEKDAAAKPGRKYRKRVVAGFVPEGIVIREAVKLKPPPRTRKPRGKPTTELVARRTSVLEESTEWLKEKVNEGLKFAQIAEALSLKSGLPFDAGQLQRFFKRKDLPKPSQGASRFSSYAPTGEEELDAAVTAVLKRDGDGVSMQSLFTLKHLLLSVCSEVGKDISPRAIVASLKRVGPALLQAK